MSDVPVAPFAAGLKFDTAPVCAVFQHQSVGCCFGIDRPLFIPTRRGGGPRYRLVSQKFRVSVLYI